MSCYLTVFVFFFFFNAVHFEKSVDSIVVVVIAVAFENLFFFFLFQANTLRRYKAGKLIRRKKKL